MKDWSMKLTLLSDRLFKTVEPIWNSYLEHPFVKGISDGSLDPEKFKHYLKQDYVYLIEYCKIFAIGAAARFGNHGPFFESSAWHVAY